jgi:hypothetical protein
MPRGHDNIFGMPSVPSQRMSSVAAQHEKHSFVIATAAA